MTPTTHRHSPGSPLAALVGAVALPPRRRPTPQLPSATQRRPPRRGPKGASSTPARPLLSALAAWHGTSPYTGVNIYFGGRNRGCAQPNLTAAWVRSASAAGWSLVPTYVGDQPFCVFGSKPYRYTASGAAARGSADGADAAARARSLGLLPGSALYADVEHYDRTGASCVTAVRTYVSEWTRALHRNGYLAGVYVHQDSGLRDLAGSYFSTSLARPDAVWMARWDNVATLTGWPTAANTAWAEWQRAKQYHGDHVETWGGVSLDIDSDLIKGPVATVAKSYRVTSTPRSTCAAARPPPPRSSASSSWAARWPSSARPAARRSGRRRSGTASAAVATCATATSPRRPRRASAPPSRAVPTPARSPHHAGQHAVRPRHHVHQPQPAAVRRCTRLRGLPEVGLAREHDPGVEPARGRSVGQRLLRLQPVQHHVQRASAAMPVRRTSLLAAAPPTPEPPRDEPKGGDHVGVRWRSRGDLRLGAGRNHPSA